MPDGTEGDSGMPLGAVAKRLGVGQHDDGNAVVGGSTPSAPTGKDSDFHPGLFLYVETKV